jgi:hypothetical protein
MRQQEGWLDDFIAGINRVGLRVLDLVNPDTQQDNKQRLFDDNARVKNGKNSDFDVVVACNLMREATDWVPADRVHDLSPTSKATRTIQTIGRMLRKYPGKTSIGYYAYFRSLGNYREADPIRDMASDRINSGLAMMVMAQDLFSPIEIELRGGRERLTLTALGDRTFTSPSDREAVQTTFVAAFADSLSRGSEIQDALRSAADTALGSWNSSGESSRRNDAYTYLFELGKRLSPETQPVVDHGTTSPEIEPSLITKASRYDPSEIRLSGFDIVDNKRSLAMAVFGASVKDTDISNLVAVTCGITKRREDMLKRAGAVRFRGAKDPAAERYMSSIKMRGSRNLNESAIVTSGSEKT